MTVKGSTAWSSTFVCKDATGALAAASVGPAGVLYINGTANGASVTISGSNPYKWTLTLPALSAGDRVDMYITATVGGIATAAIVASDAADTKRVSDLNDLAATAIVSGGAITTSGGAVSTVTGVTNGVTISTGSGAGQLDITSGVVKANLAQILGTALTETAGQIAAAFKKFFDKAAPTGTINSLPDALPSAASGLPLKSDLPAAAPSASTIAGAVLDEAKGAHTGLLAKALPDYVPSNINGLPIKSDLPAAAPDVNAIADQVWDEAIAGHLNPGSTGLALNTAGAAADPLTNPVPGTYAAGTAGAAIGSLQTGKITVVSPMSQDGLAVKLVRGDDYLNADGRALVWTDSGSNWPNLTGATVKFKWGIFTKTCTVIGAGGAHQQVSLDLTSAETDVLQNGYFDLEATLSNTHVVTLVIAGSLIIKDDV